MTEANVFRFKFSQELMNEIEYFSKLHSLDDRKTYKEEWKKWTETTEINELILSESERLTRLGCNENIDAKMFRSSRYYYRNKKNDENKKRATFVRSSVNVRKDFINEMRNFISKNLSDSPKKCLINFNENKKDLVDNEINYLVENGFDTNDASNKIKKTFKNQHYQLSHSSSS